MPRIVSASTENGQLPNLLGRAGAEMEKPEVGKLPPSFVEIEAIADEHLVWHDKADVADWEVVHKSAVRPVEQRHRCDRARPAELERAHEVMQRESGVDDVLDDDHVTVEDVCVEVLEDADLLVTAHLRAAVTGELDEVERVWDRDRPREIGDEDEARLQRADEDRLAAVVVARDLGAELVHARAELVSRQVDLADPRVRGEISYEARSRWKCWASRSRSRL